MYGVIALMTVKESQIDEFEKAVSELAKAVAANEPENRAFEVFKVRNTPGRYKLLEIYTSKDAFKVHVGSDHFKVAMPKMEATFAEPMEGELLEGL